jgi:outer membrane protein assembly factor BamB
MRSLLASCLALLLSAPAAFAQSDPTPAVKNADWPQWRGPTRDGISRETGLLKEWPKGGPALLWDAKKVNKERTVGQGLSSLVIASGKIYTIGDILKVEQVEFKDKKGKVGKKNVTKGGNVFFFCYDAETGKELWRTVIGPPSMGGPGGGPRCTPTADGDRVYVITTQGKLVCLKTGDGAILWQKDLVKEFGGRTPGFGGYCESPTIDGDKLICAPGGKKACMVALNKLSGDVYWMCEAPKNDGTGFASIVKTEVGGIKQYITLAHNQLGLIGVEAETGKFLWSYTRVANGTANIPTPIVKGDLVFASTGYGAGAALVKLVPDGQGGIKVEEQYFLKGGQLQNHHGGVVLLGDYIYGGHGHNNGLPFCLEWKTGKFAWGPERGPGNGSAAVLFADGNLYFRYESGDVALIEATPTAYKLKGSFRPQISGNGWPHPVIYHGRLYLRGNDQILCYDLRK